MPRPVVEDAQEAFTGLNTTADISQLSPTEVRTAAEAKFTTYKGITKRNGTQLVGIAGNAPVLGGIGWDVSQVVAPFLADRNGIQQIVISGGITGDINVFKLPSTGGSGENAGDGFRPNSPVSIVAFQDINGAPALYIADGGQISKFSGNDNPTYHLTGTPASIVTVAVQNQRLFGIDGVTEKLYWSELNNGDSLGIISYGGGGYDDIRTFGQQANKALIALGQSLLIVHERGISRFTGFGIDDIGILSGTQGVSADIGTTAPFSWLAVENVAFGLADRGFYEVTEFGVQQISAPIDSVIQELDRSLFPYVRAAHDKLNRTVLFYLPTVGVYAYNYRVGGWSGPWQGAYLNHDVRAMWATTDENGTPIVLCGGADGVLFRAEVPGSYLDDVPVDGTTGGSAYTMSVQCHRMYFENPVSMKSTRFGFLRGAALGPSGTAVTWNTDLSRTGTTQNVATADLVWDAAGALWDMAGTVWDDGPSAEYRIPGGVKGTYCDMTITDSGQSGAVYSELRLLAHDLGQRFGAAGRV